MYTIYHQFGRVRTAFAALILANLFVGGFCSQLQAQCPSLSQYPCPCTAGQVRAKLFVCDRSHCCTGRRLPVRLHIVSAGVLVKPTHLHVQHMQPAKFLYKNSDWRMQHGQRTGHVHRRDHLSSARHVVSVVSF